MYSQQFHTRFQIPLPDSAQSAAVTWADLDNDGLLDVLVLAADATGKQFLLTYKNDTIQGLLWRSAIATEFSNASFLLTDIDRNNTMDAILSGDRSGSPSTEAWLNQGNFSFTVQYITNSSGKAMQMADLDKDGYTELILSGGQPADTITSIYSNSGGHWQVVHDSIQINATSIEAFDFDKDGDTDLFLCGKRPDNSLISVFYNNHGELYFKPVEITPAVSGTSSLADLDGDGNFDIVLAGKNETDQDVTLAVLNHGHGFQVKDSLLALGNNKVFAADFNSNGKCDIQYLGLNTAGDTVNTIVSDNGVSFQVDHLGLQSQVSGDFDRDGDLDLLQLVKTSASLGLVVLGNETTKNLPPGRPFNAIGVTLFTRLFLYWEKPGDDHTISGSLTYDVGLQAAQEEWIAPEFDLITKKRLAVSHGNAGNKNYLLLPDPASPVNYFVQAIDNSFQGSLDCVGNIQRCASLQIENLEVCRNEQVNLQSSEEALWFSFRHGFLAASVDWIYDPEDSDTIFSVTPSLATGCTAIKMYTIKVSETLVKKTKDVKHVCSGTQVPFSAEDGWATIEWSSLTRGIISNTTSIVYTVVQNDSVTVKLSDNRGCTLERSTALIISKPVITLNGETFQILKGEEVQLSAGGGIAYHWTPATALSQNDISDPVASPAQTTQYTVTVSDSIGCTAEAPVLVLVEGTAFVPNLFTPNDDGRNDELKIYGLNPVLDFSFTIHNREGSLVYETRDISQATAVGWDGTVRGTKQPSGIYYWKIKGEQASGRMLLLNGKRSGSIVLIR
jgi:gliding motility-associated-like protein